MNQIWTVAKKELRGFFHSAVALIFLAVFLIATLFFFFFVDTFFARGIADLRPLFDRLPLLLIFLVAALTMRMWSEEQRAGTMEILLTLPIQRWKLVGGKFLAGIILVVLALGLTLGIPITVAILGNVDWGPVGGGYIAALLLAAAYLAIGLCISATTDNQIVSLGLTIVAGIALYLPGTTPVLEAVGYPSSEILRSIGTGARFESVARGVLDLRDLVYWLSLIGFFLVLNVFILSTKSWSSGKRTAKKRHSATIAIALLLANVLALNLWLAPVRSLRFDLTEDKEYSLSASTVEIVRSIDGPLLIRGYFTRETHPLLAPLVSQVSDRLMEYKAIGGSNVRVEFVDPSEDEDLQAEALTKYGIESFPVEYGDRNRTSEVNAYFSILIKYGDQQEVLQFQSIATVVRTGPADIDVRLGNLEYEVTKSIKKVAFGFQSLDSLLATLPAPPELTFYVTKDALPPELATAPQTLTEVVAELEEELGGKIAYSEVTPKTQQEQQDLFNKYQLRPFFGGVYLHLMLKVGEQLIRVVPPQDMNKAGIKETLKEALKRAAPGFVKTIGIVVPAAPPAPPPQQQFPGQRPPPSPQPPQTFQNLQQALTAEYEIQQVDLKSGRVADKIDVLIVAGPEGYGEAEVKAIDQFVMRGGSVILLVGKFRLDIQRGRLGAAKITTGLEDLLRTYGVSIAEQMVKDEEVASFPVPVQKDIGGGLATRGFERLPYPFFVKIGGERLAGHLTTAPLSEVIAHFSSPLTLMTPQAHSEDTASIETAVLLESSSRAWLQSDTDINPNFERFGDAGFQRPDEIPESDVGPHVLAVALTGTFVSHFAKGAGEEGGEEKKSEEPLISVSPAGARVAVVATSSLVDDTVAQISSQSRAVDSYKSNLNFVTNLVDWALADTQLLSIRSRGSHTRTLDLDDGGGSKWEIINYAIALIALGLFIGFTIIRRKALRPFTLEKAAKGGWTAGGGGGGLAAANDIELEGARASAKGEEE